MISKHAVSGYVGVQPKRGKWQAILQYKGKVYRLGIYEEIEDAIEARRKAKEKNTGATETWIRRVPLLFFILRG